LLGPEGSEAIDVLLVSPGTTAGWRRADGELARAIEELGATVAVCTSDYRLARHLRRTMLLTDLAEAAAMRRALTKGLRRRRPRAIIYSSPQATMLQPRDRLQGATAVRFDAPAALNRRGRLLPLLERRALRAARLLLPIGLAPHERVEAALDVETPMVALPIPIDGPESPAREREPIALSYAGNPEKKGLDLTVRAWQTAAPGGRRLVITGIDAQAGRRFLRRRGVQEPSGIEWAGFVEPERYRALSERAELFLAASRYEDYGLAQLEALARGALLVTVPSDGPYEALRHARELDGRLVAEELSAEALARALEAGVRLSAEERAAYRERARVLLRPYTRETLKQRLANEVLPVLLG
jgi:glycosyltransferase involved in cell wall biosynthesis